MSVWVLVSRWETPGKGAALRTGWRLRATAAGAQDAAVGKLHHQETADRCADSFSEPGGLIEWFLHPERALAYVDGVRVIDIVGLDKQADSRVDFFSGGMSQRLMIARAYHTTSQPLPRLRDASALATSPAIGTRAPHTSR